MAEEKEAQTETVKGLHLYTDEAEQFRVVWIGQLAFGVIDYNNADRKFLTLKCREMDKLESENIQLKQDLAEFGRHSEGCPGRFPPHKCKCGWDSIEKTLKGE